MNDLKGIIEDCNKSDLVSDKIIKKVIEIIGQEKWQDLHDENNDICTTMGELIITLKGIAELEKENNVLAQNLEDTEILNKTYEKRFNDLEKENAELKDYRLTTLAKQQTSMSKYALNLEHKLSWYDDKLTKAKKIISEFMKYEINEYDGSLEIHFEELKKQAEQFLKDREVEK